MTVLRLYLGLVRFSHTIFALPFALLSALLAWRQTEFRGSDLVGILLCMVFARSAAMAFNRLVDRRIDAGNPRTSSRHLPAGILSVRSVTVFTVATSLAFVAATLLFWPNFWPLVLSVPVLLFLLGYSYAKRFTSLCHYWLASALMLSPIAAWIAITGRIDPPPLLLAAVVFFGVGGFDIHYACQDVEFDQQRGLFSIPARMGVSRALKIAAASHALAAASLFGLWYVAGMGTVFLVGVIAVTLLLIAEHLLVRPSDLTRVNLAFFQVNAVISLGLLALGAADLWLG